MSKLYASDSRDSQAKGTVPSRARGDQKSIQIRRFRRGIERTASWLSRKFTGGVRCLREHGLGYTIKRTFEKIGTRTRNEAAWQNLVKLGLNKEPRTPRIIVYLIPSSSQSPNVEWMLRRLLGQSDKADRLILWLAEDARCEWKELPLIRLSKLLQYGIEIRRNDAASVGQALFSTLEEFPNDIVIAVGDDSDFQSDTIERLYQAYRNNPDMMHCLQAAGLRYGVEQSGLEKDYDGKAFPIPSYLNLACIGAGCLFPPAVFSAGAANFARSLPLEDEDEDMRCWLAAILSESKINVIGPMYDAAQDSCAQQMKPDCGHEASPAKSRILFDLRRIFATYPDLQMRLLNEQNEMEALKRALAVPQHQKDYNYYKNIDSALYRAEICLWYQNVMHCRLDIDHPKTYNEKIQWMKLYDSSRIKSRLTDKYAVRDWVAERIGSQYLVKLLGVWDSVDDIDLDRLPNQFVLKATHGSSWVIVVPDKTKLDWESAKQKMRQWLITNFAFVTGLELHYKRIPPRIIAEEYLENSDGDIYDYKLWCFEGKVHSVMFLSERKTGDLKMAFYNQDWERLDLSYHFTRDPKQMPRPEQLEQMIAISERLSEGFPHTRIDLYLLNNGEIKFGEVTFTSASGACDWDPPEADRMLGELFSLPEAIAIP